MANDHSTSKAIIRACAFYDQGLVGPGSPDKEFGPAKSLKCVSNNSSSVSSPSSTNSNGDHSSVINFKPEYSNSGHNSGSLLSFEYPVWEDGLYSGGYHGQLINSTTTSTSTATHDGGGHFAWLNDVQEASTVNNVIQDLGRKESTNANKRSSMGESVQAPKKPKISESSSKDPQSIAAKNRRERISERLKVLQELVPNGSKVDLVTMLEKAIGYVKFLQLQVKVLAADEFWPAQGGKAPDLAQVKEAIDAILATQRDRNSSSGIQYYYQLKDV